MSDNELKSALSTLYAADKNNGTADETLRATVVTELRKDRSESELFSMRVTKIARDLFLSDEAIAQGYGLEDIRDFINWLDEAMR